MHRVEQSLAGSLTGVETLLVGDLNAHLAQLQHQREEDLATTIANYRLVNQTLHFIPRPRYSGKGVSL